jgi:hypothetical protein
MASASCQLHPEQWSCNHRRDLTVSHAFALDALRWMRRWLRGAQVCLAEAMGLDGSTQRIVTGLTFFSRPGRPCLCLAGASVGAGFCGVRAASHLAAGSFLHSSHRYVLSSSSGLLRRLQDLQGDVRPFLLRVMNWRPDVFMPHFPRNRVDDERDRLGSGSRMLHFICTT